MAESGFLIRPEWLPTPVSGRPLKGYMQMKEILVQDVHPTAVVAISDKTALGAMEAIRREPNTFVVTLISKSHHLVYTPL